ncbi:hypothetical protein JL101_024270 [Skermanella rosea]|uniref:hypothetical protein n=1 Tax=Skermanella rosea TaxID=1817965 RepID=UPI001E3C190D|nr:hypothetical protein [Skermanella rosea]UEM03053.1 hypothetical protein JL101_024270 [Skermanella rosea]
MSATASTPTPALQRRHEVFARHVAAGRSLAEAARLSGYAWNSARQTGSRLMQDGCVAARVVELAAEEDRRRREEADELVAVLKRVLFEAVDKQNYSAALRAADQIARFRGLLPPAPKAGRHAGAGITGTIAAALAEAEDEDDGALPADPDAPGLVGFDPPMPPAAIAPVEPMRNLKEEARKRHAAAVERNSRCLKLILGRHKDNKELKARIESSDDAHLFFDADYRLLPPDQWPGADTAPAPRA